MSQYQTLGYEVADSIATITLNRPQAANGMDLTLGRELMDAALQLANRTDVRAVVLTGNGSFFSAGGDLNAFAAFGEQISAKIHELTVYLHTAVSALMRMPAPVIVAVNGVAAGAGFSLAMAGDIVLAADSAKFTMAYTGAGLAPDGGASYTLPRLIGLRRTQELMLTNRRLSAEEALDWGLITRIVPAEQLQAEAQTLAAQLAAGPTCAFGGVKQLLSASFDNGLEQQMALEGSTIARLSASRDGQEGINAFLAKRRPQFSGQ